MWIVKQFDELSVYQLYEIYQLRVAVFVVEQECAYQEVDELDLDAIHLFQKEGDNLTAYARLVPEADQVRLGRVIVHPQFRGQQKGHALLEKAIAIAADRYPTLPMIAGAQAHLQKFYEAFDFRTVSDVYLEDDIPHVDMIRTQTREEGGNLD